MICVKKAHNLCNFTTYLWLGAEANLSLRDYSVIYLLNLRNSYWELAHLIVTNLQALFYNYATANVALAANYAKRPIIDDYRAKILKLKLNSLRGLKIAYLCKLFEYKDASKTA